MDEAQHNIAETLRFWHEHFAALDGLIDGKHLNIMSAYLNSASFMDQDMSPVLSPELDRSKWDMYRTLCERHVPKNIAAFMADLTDADILADEEWQYWWFEMGIDIDDPSQEQDLLIALLIMEMDDTESTAARRVMHRLLAGSTLSDVDEMSPKIAELASLLSV